jgi:hypothetical protein
MYSNMLWGEEKNKIAFYDTIYFLSRDLIDPAFLQTIYKKLIMKSSCSAYPKSRQVKLDAAGAGI